MNIIRGIFEKRKNADAAVTAPAAGDPSKDPNLVRVFDDYGRECFVTKEQWRDMLVKGLEKDKGDPERLYNGLVTALRDGYFEEVLPAARHLADLEPDSSRSAMILGIIYLHIKQLEQARNTLEVFITRNGDNGVVLTNLAKVYSAQGHDEQARATLWHALEVDPNQDNGLNWYVAIAREAGGDAKALAAYQQVAALPGSWRARLGLARAALNCGDKVEAVRLYEEALTIAAQPLPADMLMQISGDLGNAGSLAELVALVEPRFDCAVHGLLVGNNLIKAHFDLGQLDAARRILEQLYAQQRPDWQRALSMWDTKIASAAIAAKAPILGKELAKQPTVSYASIEGPIWGREGSPFGSLLPAKRADAVRVAVLGSVSLFSRSSEEAALQMADWRGRLSRAIPLFLAEQLHLETDCRAIALTPWVEGAGFAVFGRPLTDAELLQVATMMIPKADLAIAVTVDAMASRWKLNIHMLSQHGWTVDSVIELDNNERPGMQVLSQAKSVIQSILSGGSVRLGLPPLWYRPPDDMTDYLLRLEQHLATVFASFKDGGLSGERDIVSGALQLCLREPRNAPSRMLLARTLSEMKKTRPQVVGEFKEKVSRLQMQYPLYTPVAGPLDQAFQDALH